MRFLSLFSKRPDFSDGEIDLYLSDDDVRDPSCGIDDGYTFCIYPHKSNHYAGYVSLRIGESPELFYLGHIGYRIEQDYRGNGYAQKACRLIIPLIRKLGIRHPVITTDTNNMPSRKTCENLGCVLEGITPVPEKYQPVCAGSKAKCRYIWQDFEGDI